MTDYSNKITVLAQAYTAPIQDEGWLQFKSYTDVGLPLAYLLESGVVEITPDTQDSIEGYIDETYTLLMEMLEIEEDIRDTFEKFDDIIEHLDSK